MKTRLLLVSMAISLSIYAQIGITHSDFASAFAVGSEYTSYATPIGGPALTVFVGEPSVTAQTWDFSGYEYLLAGNGIGVDASSAPFHSTFPAANTVVYEKMYGFKADTLYSWTYHELQSDKFLLYGVSDETTLWFSYDPPAIQAVLPFTYGTSWIKDWDSTYFMPEVWIISKSEFIVDGFGTLKLPSGDYPCLRLTSNDYIISHTPLGYDSALIRGYHWYAKDITQLHITTIPEDQFDLSTIDINAFSYSIPGGPAGIDKPISDKNISVLEQNHPNPFVSETTIGYKLSNAGNVVLKVYDFTGKEIETLVDERQTAGYHEVSFSRDNLVAGIYFFRLETEGSSLRKKMMIMD
jgi:hypothetical protein